MDNLSNNINTSVSYLNRDGHGASRHRDAFKPPLNGYVTCQKITSVLLSIGSNGRMESKVTHTPIFAEECPWLMHMKQRPELRRCRHPYQRARNMKSHRFSQAVNHNALCVCLPIATGVPMLSVQPKGKQKGCAGCNRKIKDRYLLKALDKYWHEDCLKCACCDCRLGEVGSTLYTKANLILCRRDYLR